MKETMLLLLFAIKLANFSYAQPNLLGTCSMGGEQFGTIVHYSGGDTLLDYIYRFHGNPGASPVFTNCVEAGGKLYGLTSQGGVFNAGVIFEYNVSTDTYVCKHNFSGGDGRGPEGSLLLASNGKFYGMTVTGGVNNCGVIFEYDFINSIYIKKIDLNDTIGRLPRGSLMQAANGKLYGMTQYGGTPGSKGVIFEYDYNTNIYLKKINLYALNGCFPVGSLTEAPNGKLYGLTINGGASFDGVLFEYDYNTNVYTMKIDLSPSTGNLPFGSLMLSANGKFYGLQNMGGLNNSGVIFEYDPNTNTYLKKVDLYSINGIKPQGNLIEASNGKLYGLTTEGGAFGLGIIFEYDYNTNLCQHLVDLSDIGGSSPRSTMIQSWNGKLYGLTYRGGIRDLGVIFEYDINSAIYTKKIDLYDNSKGSAPFGTLVQATNGQFYGLTRSGGADDVGVIYEYDYGTNVFSKQIDLIGSTGAEPFGALIQASNGKMYGLTSSGGANNLGVVFEYDPNINTYLKKVDFTDLNGSRPYGSLLQASNSKLYGMTNQGGTGLGVIFEYDYVSNILNKKIELADSIGRNPVGSLIEVANGKLYGMTTQGGLGNGVIFEYDYFTNNYIKKVEFNQINGSSPSGSLLKASNGNLYGITSDGGVNNSGVIFEYDYLNNIYTTKVNLSDTIGSHPYGTLFEASNGKLYGFTSDGGLYNGGVIFEYDYISNIYIKKVDLLMDITGSLPLYSSFVEFNCFAQTITASGPISFCQGGSVLLTSTGIPGSLYQWNKNGNPIPGATNQSYLVTNYGKYDVSVSDSICSFLQTSNYIRVRIPCIPPLDPQEKNQFVSSDVELSKFFVSYGYTNQNVVIAGHALKGGIYRLSIIDNVGRRFQIEDGKIVNSELLKQLNISSLSCGIYFIEFITDKEKFIRKVVKYD